MIQGSGGVFFQGSYSNNACAGSTAQCINRNNAHVQDQPHSALSFMLHIHGSLLQASNYNIVQVYRTLWQVRFSIDRHTMSSPSWNDRADELAKQVLAKQTASAWQHLQSYALRMDFFKKVSVHCSKIVCAVVNRDGYGVNGRDVHENVDDTFYSGWHDQFFMGLLTDILPEEREDVLSFNEKLVNSSKGQLAPVDRDIVKYQTLAGSHTNQGHRQLYILYIYIYIMISC